MAMSLVRRMVVMAMGASACATTALAQGGPISNRIELPAMRIVRIQTTVTVPGNTDGAGVIGNLAEVGPDERVVYVSAGPWRRVAVVVQTVQPGRGMTPEKTGGIDPFLIPGLDEKREGREAKAAAEVPALEMARRALRESREGDQAAAKAAVEHYARHLATSPRDGEARREMALALWLSGAKARGAELLREAYRDEAGVVAVAAANEQGGGPDADVGPRTRLVESFAVSLVPGGKAGLERLATDAVAEGHRTRSAAGWLMCAALLRADGRVKEAARVLERAEAAGLEKEIVKGMKRALSDQRDSIK